MTNTTARDASIALWQSLMRTKRMPPKTKLTLAWSDGNPTPILTTTCENTSAHAQIQARAGTQDPELVALINAWSAHAPIFWDYTASGLPGREDKTTRLTFLWSGHLFGVEALLPSFASEQGAPLVRTTGMSSKNGKQGLELQRLLIALSSVQSPITRWSSTMGGRLEQAYLAGPTLDSAVVMDRLLRACSSTLKQSTMTTALGEKVAIMRVYVASDAPDPTPVW